MQITYFRLKGYINILQGMGQDEIIIPFNQFHNRIILIQGENGTGKSTILKALSPNPDSADSFRTDVMVNNGVQQIVEYPGEKEIHYKDDLGNIYKVLIQSVVDESRTRRTTKAYISKNGEEFNPNGTVSGFKEARDNLLGIDPVYLDMSAISSENRGLVDMIPSERRKYLSSYIGSVETFNEIYKVISKKASACKSYLNSLNTKIYSMGNELELRVRQTQLEDQLKDANNQRDELLKSLAEAEATIKVVDPDNKIQDLYLSISERLQSLKDDIMKNKKVLEDLYTKIDISREIEENGLDKEIEETNNGLNSHKKSLIDYNNRIANLIALNEATEVSLNRDKSRLLGISSEQVQSNIESVVDDLHSQIEVYNDYLKHVDIELYNSLSVEILHNLLEDLKCFIELIDSARDYSEQEEIFIEALDNDNLKSRLDEINRSSLNASIETDSCKTKIESLNGLKEKIDKFDSLRPKDCITDECPFISEYIKIMKEHSDIDKEISDMQSIIDFYTVKAIEYESDIHKLEEAIKIREFLDKAFSIIDKNQYVLSKIKELNWMNDKDILISHIKDHFNFFQIITLLNDYLEKASIYEELKGLKSKYDSLSGDLKLYQSNKKLIESLQDSINSMEKEIEDRKRDIKKYTNECEFLNKLIEQLQIRSDLLQELKVVSNKDNELELEMSKLREEYSKIKDNIRVVKEKVDSLNDIKNNIELVEKMISPITEEINKVKFNIANIMAYQEEFQEYSVQYEKLSFIKDACSPGSGKSIQSEYVKMYMNDIIITCNTLLGYMFSGSIRLDLPVINEKQFSIPFIGPNGFQVPDISNGSTAQKCMIGLVFSCVSMMKSSSTYNIPRFDEIDGGLDQENRIVFINVINQILDIMKAKQCIMISHNNEFDTQSTTIIECARNGIKFSENGNFI